MSPVSSSRVASSWMRASAWASSWRWRLLRSRNFVRRPDNRATAGRVAASIRKWPSSTAGAYTKGSRCDISHIAAPKIAVAKRQTRATVWGRSWNMPNIRITSRGGKAAPRKGPAMA